jgi:subtilisin family serine protease
MNRPVRHALRAISVCAVFAALGLSSAQAADISRMIVTFKDGQGAAAKAAIAKTGGRVLIDLARIDAAAVSLPTRAIAELQRHPAIAGVENDELRYAFRVAKPTGVRAVRSVSSSEAVPYGITAVQAAQVTFNAANAPKICITDSGYNLGHEDLQTTNVDGVNLTAETDWSDDQAHHGTHVAGTILATGGNGKGVVGVIPTGNANLYIAKVFDVSGSAPSSVIIQGVLACQSAGARIINMSLGGGSPNLAEAKLYNQLSRQNILVVAAAGNAGNTSKSYPASYGPVVSVAAVDEAKVHATFSQVNNKVDLSGPGVDTLSTVPMGEGGIYYTTVGGSQIESTPMEGTPVAIATAPLYDFALGKVVDVGAAGKVCLISRGEIAFSDKVLNCQNSGGLGAVIYNNTTGRVNGTLGGVVTAIPSVGITQADGQSLLGQIGAAATVDTSTVVVTNYQYFSGTSMATPHVVGVAALVWSNFPQCTAKRIASSLTKHALDLGAVGYDNEYGNGLVQAKATFDGITANGCGN